MYDFDAGVHLGQRVGYTCRDGIGKCKKKGDMGRGAIDNGAGYAFLGVGYWVAVWHRMFIICTNDSTVILHFNHYSYNS